MRETTRAQKIRAFNESNAPFYLVDHKDEVSLCCVFHPMPDSVFSLGQEAFNRYAERIGDPVKDEYGLFTHGSGYEWEYVFRKAFENDPNIGKVSFDCEAGGFFCYGESVDMMADFGRRFRQILNDTDFLTELICKAVPEGEQREAELEQLRRTVRGFLMMGNMGADIFDLPWIKETIRLFSLFGWTLFVAGFVVAIFDVAIEYQCGRANIRTTSINILKGFFACSLIGVVPVELYKFCISLQNTFSRDLISVLTGGQTLDLAGQSTTVLEGCFAVSADVTFGLLNLLCLIAFAYCVVKIFFQNIKRGGILLVQMAVGSLYMFSVPRGYTDGFNQWCKQVAAICLTAFLQTSLLFLGLLTFPDHMLLGLGIMLAANEVPRIAQQFGLDSSVRVNMMSVVHATTTAVNLTRSLAAAK